ncbi:glycerol-3-phosphate dehydrogenase (NAD(P)+) [Sphingomonas jejuensis]|uniref:Glycerol-3-phosphate dehydrogenase [NAD(P)+] n=1 Tax=Sphingomonas jejuensis TaxID=904715 RepID=A0ABX0XN81_9SPHN|nr:NAD(P)H-dependent glycerol-3-phosphate dehydrogenase [Sphingomonas jejuensis]NJC34842.1 glycerol-3-phosphate dehydrogenase (NAD(P)+) [Sphingomonas jejuensis]
MIGVIGAGAWGTALAQAMASNGEDVVLWARDPAVADTINDSATNPAYLPGITLSPSVRATSRIGDLAAAEAWLVVTPAQAMGEVLRTAPAGDQPLILCCKGIEAGTRRLMSEVAPAARPRSPIAVLSGPTFAHEVAAGLPTAVTLACADPALGERLVQRIARPTFRPYLSDDVVGAEIGGAVKNVLAIACGVVAGARLGENGRASLIARGFAEMSRFGRARGARESTIAGLSGLGDLVLTCSSQRSRNFALGFGIGEGRTAAELLGDRRTVAEGAFTAPVLRAAADEAGIDMPVTAAVCDLLAGAQAADVIRTLLSRPLRAEA